MQDTNTNRHKSKKASEGQLYPEQQNDSMRGGTFDCRINHLAERLVLPTVDHSVQSSSYATLHQYTVSILESFFHFYIMTKVLLKKIRNAQLFFASGY